MRAARWTAAALAALCLAVVPGALRLVPAARGLERAHLLVSDHPSRQGAPASVVESTTLPSTPPVAGGEVAIRPPAELSGEPAPAVPVPRPYAQARGGVPGEVFALVVGVDDYPGTDYDLDAAVADADTIDLALARFGVPAANRVVLRDGQVQRDQLVGALQALVARAGPGTTLVFAYAGHVRKVDQDTEELVTADGAAVTDQELASLLAPSRSEHRWLLLATCYAGGFTEAVGPGDILTGAADADSLAYESPSIHGSYLVHHMVREGWLEGRAGRSIQEAFAFADARIGEQHPERRPVQVDHAGTLLRLGPGSPSSGTGAAGGTSASPSGQGQPASEPPPSSTTTEPERTCTLLVLCRRG